MRTLSEMPLIARMTWALVGYSVTLRVCKVLTINVCFGIASEAMVTVGKLGELCRVSTFWIECGNGWEYQLDLSMARVKNVGMGKFCQKIWTVGR